MTKQQLDEIRKRCEAATEGPWEIQGRRGGKDTGVYFNPGPSRTKFTICTLAQLTRYNKRPERLRNLRFIAHARTDIPALLEYIESLQGQLAEAREVIGVYADGYVFDEPDEDTEQLDLGKSWRNTSGKRARAYLEKYPVKEG